MAEAQKPIFQETLENPENSSFLVDNQKPNNNQTPGATTSENSSKIDPSTRQYSKNPQNTSKTQTTSTSEFKNSTNPNSTRKNVSFFEISSDVPVNDTQDVFSVMLSGTQMVKIRSNTRLYERYFWLNEETSSIHWEPSKKDAATLSLSCIKEVRWGQTTDSVGNLRK